ncbi:hypothetical protein JW979_06735, partial [bacterium]|nr:hypothetical protein [candidate division CSSED10-310 bacterium]
PSNMSAETLTTTIIDCSDLTDTTLTFYCWLGVESSAYDHAALRIKAGSASWNELWANSSTREAGSWEVWTFDISGIADGQESVQLQWVMGSTDSLWQYCGWNIDDVAIWGWRFPVDPTPSPTSPGTPPTATPTYIFTSTPSVPTPTPEIIPTETVPPDPSHTSIPSSTPTPVVTATYTPIPTHSSIPTETPVPSQTPQLTSTPTPTHAPTVTPSLTPQLPTATPFPTETAVPTATTIPTHTPLPTHSPFPSATPQQATSTPSPTITPPNPTATPACSNLGVEIRIPRNFFTPGDVFECKVYVCNPELKSKGSTPLFVILDVYGYLYFAPGFNAFDYYTIELLPGMSTQIVLPPFQWPENSGEGHDIRWYAGMTDPEITQLIGEMDMVSFGWGPD